MDIQYTYNLEIVYLNCEMAFMHIEIFRKTKILANEILRKCLRDFAIFYQ